MKGIAGSQCFECVHRLPENRPVCAAFPKGIPEALLKNAVDHRYPYPGDKGIRFEISPQAAQLRSEYGVPLPEMV